MNSLCRLRIIASFIFIVGSLNVYSHAVQLAYGVSCSGKIRLWVEHWHTTENPSSTTMTITFNGNTFTSPPAGAVYGTPLGSLPGNPISFAACPQANTYNDWIFYDFNIPCNTNFTITVLSGNNVFTQDNCGMMPATISGTVPCIPLTVSTTGASICPGGTANLSATASAFTGGTFVWNPGNIQGDNINVTPGATTTYTVTYTSPDGCTATATATVTVLPVPAVSVTSTSICPGFSGTITATGNPAGGTYSWAPTGGTGNTLTDSPQQTETYTVTYTAPNGCTKTGTGTITVKPEPQPFISIVNPVICVGQSTMLIANSGFPGTATFSWSPGGQPNSAINVSPTTTTTYTVTVTMNGCVATATATVIVEDIPIVTANPITICSGQSGTINTSVSISGGSYSWSPGGATTSSITVSPASNTTYTVTYTSPAGCVGTTTVTATVVSLPTVSVAPKIICSGSSTTLTAVPSVFGGSYSWSPGGNTTATITVAPGTTSTYTVTYTLSSGCTATASATVTVNPQPTVSFNSATICSGNSTTLTATPSIPGGNYTWNPGGNTSPSINVSPTVTTTYTVSYTLNGCSATATGLVTVNPTPTVSVNNASVCSGNPATLTATPSINGGTYSWNPGGATTQSISVTPASATTYTVTYSLNGCTATAIAQVSINTIPTVSINPATICNGASASLTANPSTSGGTYLWNPGGATSQTVNVSPASTTTYTVTYTLNGCSNTGTAVVTVNPVPTVSVDNATVCAGSSATLTATPSLPGGTYLWNPTGAITNSITDAPNTTTTYTVTYTLNGCSSTGTGTINVNPIPVVQVSSSFICNGGTATISATPSVTGGTYLWNPTGATTSSITDGPASTTTYTVTYTVNGCVGTGTGTINVGQVPTVAVNSITICNGSTAGLTATPSVTGGTFSWTPTGGTSQTENVSPTTTTTYTVTYSLNGCSSTASATVTVNPVPTVSVNDVTVCLGTSATLTAMPSIPGGTYLWNPTGAATNSIADAPNTTTTYTVTYTLNGCSTTATGTININPIPTATINSATVCIGSSATLTATPSLPGGTYLWNPTGATTNSISDAPNATTTYTVTYTLNGCSTTATGTINVNPIPAVSINDVTVCAGTSATLTATASLPGGTYLWNPTGATTNSITDAPLTTTTYTVTYTLNGCSSTATGTINVIPVPAVAVSSAAICIGSSATLTATPTLQGGTYLWNPTGAISASITETPIITTTYTVTYTLNGCSSTATGMITVNSIPTISVNSATVCLGTSATLTATPSAAGGTYLWSPSGATTSSITDAPLTTTTYTVTYSLIGCSATATATINVNPIPDISANTATVCAGTSATLTALSSMPGGTYLWNPTGATTNSITDAPLSTTTYTVTYTLNNCSNTATGTINVNPVPTVQVNSATICIGSSATLTATPSVPGGTYNWSILAGSSSPSITVSPPVTTQYVVVYTVAGCSGTGTGTVTVNPIPAASVNTITICNGSAGTLTASTNLSGGTFLWSPGGATTASVSLSPATTTTYTVSYTLNLCTTTATGTINVNPVPTVSANSSTICDGQTANSTATPSIAGGNYLWTPGNLTTATINVAPLTTTTYTVTYTLNGCSNTGTALITVLPPLNVVAGTDAKICEGTSANLTAVASGGNGGPYTYLWAPATGLNNPNISNPVATPAVTTTYTVTIDDNCSTPKTATVTITISPLPIVTFTADITSGCVPLCVNFTDNSTATSGIASWQWNFGNGNTSTLQNPLHCFNTPGDYSITLTVTSNDRCINTTTYTNYIHVYPIPTANFSMSDTVVSILESNIQFIDQSSNDVVSWAWDFGEPSSGTNNTSSLQNPLHTYFDPGSYCVNLIVSNQYGCKDTTEKCLRVEDDFTFYIPNAFSPNNDGKNDFFSGKGQGFTDYVMYIFDRWGEQIYKTEDINKPWDGRANGGTEMAQIDVYVYLVILKDIRGEEHRYTGTVTIVR